MWAMTVLTPGQERTAGCVRDRGHRHPLGAAAGGAMSGKVHYTVSGHPLSRPRFAVNELCVFPSHS